MDTYLRILARQYAASQDPELAIKIANAVVRGASVGDLTFYAVVYFAYLPSLDDAPPSVQIFLTEEEAAKMASQWALDFMEVDIEEPEWSMLNDWHNAENYSAVLDYLHDSYNDVLIVYFSFNLDNVIVVGENLRNQQGL